MVVFNRVRGLWFRTVALSFAAVFFVSSTCFGLNLPANGNASLKSDLALPQWLKGKVSDIHYFFDLKSGKFYSDNTCKQPIVGTLRGSQESTVVIQVLNINPLYIVKTTATALIIDYGIPDPFTSQIPQSIAPLPDIDKDITKANAYYAAFTEVGQLARRVTLDSVSTRKTLAKHTNNIGQDTLKPPSAFRIKSDFQNLSIKLKQDSASADRCNTVQIKALADARKEVAVILARPDFEELPQYWVVMRDGHYEADNRNRPIVLEGDRVQVELAIVKRPEFTLLPAADLLPYIFFIHTVGFVTLDVSAGLVFNGLRDYEYTLRDSLASVRDTTVSIKRYKRIQENNTGSDKWYNGLRPGLATLLNLRYKATPGFSAGISGGATLVADTKSILQYHLGLSALFGDRQRVVVTAGYSWGYVRRLADGYAPNEKVPYMWTSVPTKQEYNRYFMVGVTYNLTSVLKPLYTVFSSDTSKPTASAVAAK